MREGDGDATQEKIRPVRKTPAPQNATQTTALAAARGVRRAGANAQAHRPWSSLSVDQIHKVMAKRSPEEWSTSCSTSCEKKTQSRPGSGSTST